MKADGQRPAAYLQEMPEKVTVTTSQIAELRTKDYFEAMYNEAETVRGNLFSCLLYTSYQPQYDQRGWCYDWYAAHHQ